MYYSKSTGGFYDAAIHGNQIPADAVAITRDEHAALLQAQSEGQVIAPGPDGRPCVIDPPSAIITAASMCHSIDTAADAARLAVAGDPLRAVEYEKAAAEAAAYADADYPADACPRSVAAWAINGRTPRQAADSILAEAAAYAEALYQIRETRLQAKEQVRQAMAANQVEQARLIASAAIDSIRAAITGIGNAGA